MKRDMKRGPASLPPSRASGSRRSRALTSVALLDLRSNGGIGGLKRRPRPRWAASRDANEREQDEENANCSPIFGHRSPLRFATATRLCGLVGEDRSAFAKLKLRPASWQQSARRGAPAEHALFQPDQEIVRRNAKQADCDRPDKHVAHPEPGARIIDEVAEACVCRDKLRSDDNQKANRQTEPQAQHDVGQDGLKNDMTVELEPPESEALAGTQEDGVDIAHAELTATRAPPGQSAKGRLRP
jgi:hypothetical protein